MSGVFVHSVKVPRFYKVTARAVQSVEEEETSLKQKIYEKKHPNLLGTYALASTTIQHGPQLDELLRKTQLLFKEPRLDPWLARVLITELLWGKQSLASEAKPVKTILSYEKILREHMKNTENIGVDDAASRKKVKKLRYVRINTLVKSIEDSISSFTDDGWTILSKARNYSNFLETIANLEENTFVQDYHVPELFVFPAGTHFYNHPGYKSGAIVLQDKASCLPAYLLNPTPGSTVLDMCSAPGMKTTHLAAVMKNEGKIIAVEKDSRRYKTLCEIIKTNGADCVMTVNGDAMKVDPEQCADVEYVLVDPSCSGSGMLDRMTVGKTDSKCAPGRLISLQSFQVLLLRHALLNFPKVKRVVYSTCSMYPEENEMVVDEILDSVKNSYDLVPVKNLIGDDWKNFSSKDYKCEDRCLYARPDDDMCNGFFVAIFERNFDVPLPDYSRKTTGEKRTKSNDVKTEIMDCQIKNENKRIGKSNGNTWTTRNVGESVDVESQGSKLSNGKEKNLTGTKRKSKMTKQGVKLEVEETLPEDEPPKKSKKKNKHVKAEPKMIDETVEVDNEITPDETSVQTKKKNKKRCSDAEILEDQIPEKKKKKKRSDVEILEVISKVEVTDDQISEKKKKKKRSDVEILEVISKVEVTDDQISEKKKKKKRRSDVEILEVSSGVETTEDQIPEKKKKKKRSNVEILEVTPTVEESEIQISKTKKKKKNKHVTET